MIDETFEKLQRRGSTGWGDEDIGTKQKKTLFNMDLDIEVILLRLYCDIDDLLIKRPETKLREMITSDLVCMVYMRLLTHCACSCVGMCNVMLKFDCVYLVGFVVLFLLGLWTYSLCLYVSTRS